MNEIELMMLKDYRLTTANILYHMPDHPWFLQTYVWQNLDHVPDFPELKKFLTFWEKSLDGKLHSVVVASSGLIKPTEFSYSKGEFTIH